MTDLRGTFTALVTPFADDGTLDEPAFRRMVRRQIEGGVEGLVPCGTTGEAATLDPAEQERLIAWTVEEAGGRVRVVAGTGANDTRRAVALAAGARRAGADAILVVTPYYNKPTQAGLLAHYRAIADASPLPLVLYNVPGRTGVNMLPETVLALAEHERIVAVKEASGSLDQASEILRWRPEGFLLLSGEDSLTLPMLALGGDGVIGVVPNEAPEPFSRLVRSALAGDGRTAAAIHLELLPLMKANFVESNPIPVKYAMHRLGLCANSLRLPLVPASAGACARIDAALASVGLLAGEPS